MSILRNGPVALSNLRVKGPHVGCQIHELAMPLVFIFLEPISHVTRVVHVPVRI